MFLIPNPLKSDQISVIDPFLLCSIKITNIGGIERTLSRIVHSFDLLLP